MVEITTDGHAIACHGCQTNCRVYPGHRFDDLIRVNCPKPELLEALLQAEDKKFKKVPALEPTLDYGLTCYGIEDQRRHTRLHHR